MTLDELVEDPEQMFSGNKYDLGVDYSDPQEPIVMVYRRDGQPVMTLFNQPPGLCWAFSHSLDSFLHDPAFVDLLAEDIVDYLNNELISAIEEGPPDEQLLLFPLHSKKKLVEDEPPYSVDHHLNPYTNRKYCFFD